MIINLKKVKTIHNVVTLKVNYITENSASERWEPYYLWKGSMMQKVIIRKSSRNSTISALFNTSYIVMRR